MLDFFKLPFFLEPERSCFKSAKLFLPDLAACIGVEKVQLHVQDLLVDSSRLGPAVICDPPIHRRRHESSSRQYPGGSKQPVEGPIVTAERSIEQRALWTLVGKDLYHLHDCQSLLCLLLGVWG